MYGVRHEKTDLKVFVVVISKEGWAQYDNDKDLKVCFLVTLVIIIWQVRFLFNFHKNPLWA